MTRTRTTRHIAADPGLVWDVLSDVARWPDWLDTVRSLDRLDDGPFGVGSRVRISQPGLPRAQWQVTSFVPGRSFTWESRVPGLRSIGTHEVVPDGAGAQVTLGIEWVGLLAPVVARVWGRRTREYVEREGRCLADRVGGVS